jgi:hypothetical protein
MSSNGQARAVAGAGRRPRTQSQSTWRLGKRRQAAEVSAYRVGWPLRARVAGARVGWLEGIVVGWPRFCGARSPPGSASGRLIGVGPGVAVPYAVRTAGPMGMSA